MQAGRLVVCRGLRERYAHHASKIPSSCCLTGGKSVNVLSLGMNSIKPSTLALFRVR